MQRSKLMLEKTSRYLPDKLYLYIFFYRARREFLHLKNPLKFTEKIQWLKLYGNLEKYSRYADKFAVRAYIEEKVGPEYLIPLLGVWDNFDDIPFDQLPKRFVLKVTHGCGYNYICKDKSKIDFATLKTTVNGWLNENFYKQEREPQYKPCAPKIVCEAYLEDGTGGLCDYKFYCSNGIPKVIQVDTDRFIDHKSDLMDVDWNKLSYVSVGTFGGLKHPPKKPANLKKMLNLAQKLSQDFPFVRVDLYSVGNKVYFGELTFTPGSGIVQLTPESGDIELGKLIDLAGYSATA